MTGKFIEITRCKYFKKGHFNNYMGLIFFLIDVHEVANWIISCSFQPNIMRKDILHHIHELNE